MKTTLIDHGVHANKLKTIIGIICIFTMLPNFLFGQLPDDYFVQNGWQLDSLYTYSYFESIEEWNPNFKILFQYDQFGLEESRTYYGHNSLEQWIVLGMIKSFYDLNKNLVEKHKYDWDSNLENLELEAKEYLYYDDKMRLIERIDTSYRFLDTVKCGYWEKYLYNEADRILQVLKSVDCEQADYKDVLRFNEDSLLIFKVSQFYGNYSELYSSLDAELFEYDENKRLIYYLVSRVKNGNNWFVPRYRKYFNYNEHGVLSSVTTDSYYEHDSTWYLSGERNYYYDDFGNSDYSQSLSYTKGGEIYQKSRLNLYCSPQNLTTVSSEKGLGAIKLYPNPTNGNIKIECQGESGPNFKLMLFDALGHVCYHRELVKHGKYLEFQLPKLSPGMYFIRLESGKKYSIEKIQLF